MRVNTPLHCVMGSDGKYYAQGTLMTYYNQEARTNNLDPWAMEIGDINLEIDPSGVFKVVFDGLKQKFTNCTDVVDPVIQQEVTQPAEQPADSNTGSGADAATPSQSNANAQAPASTSPAQA